jgi:ketosteroid isomerase-like protein
MSSTDFQADVMKCEEQRYAAMLSGDVSALREVFADDSIYTHSNGLADDKQGYLNAFSSGEFVYRTIERFEETVKMVDDGAIINGRIRLTVDFKSGPKLLESRFLSVWVKNGPRWQHLAWQSTPIKT